MGFSHARWIKNVDRSIYLFTECVKFNGMDESLTSGMTDFVGSLEVESEGRTTLA